MRERQFVVKGCLKTDSQTCLNPLDEAIFNNKIEGYQCKSILAKAKIFE